MRINATLAAVAASAVGIALASGGPAAAAEPTYTITYDTCKGHFTPPVIIRAIRDGDCKTFRVTYATAVKVVAKSFAAGARPRTSARAEVVRPLKLFVRVIAERGLRRHVQWQVECDSGDEDVRDARGGFTTARSDPRSVPFSVPNPYSCKLDVSARSVEPGALRLRVMARFVSGEIAREEVG